MWYNLLQWVKDLFRGNLLGGVSRSSRWPAVRKQFLQKYPTCAACGKKGTILKPNECHHLIPFSYDKSKELDFANLATACRRCHLLIFHLDSWRSFSPIAKEDAAILLSKIKNRPKVVNLTKK